MARKLLASIKSDPNYHEEEMNSKEILKCTEEMKLEYESFI